MNRESILVIVTLPPESHAKNIMSPVNYRRLLWGLKHETGYV